MKKMMMVAAGALLAGMGAAHAADLLTENQLDVVTAGTLTLPSIGTTNTSANTGTITLKEQLDKLVNATSNFKTTNVSDPGSTAGAGSNSSAAGDVYANVNTSTATQAVSGVAASPFKNVADSSSIATAQAR